MPQVCHKPETEEDHTEARGMLYVIEELHTVAHARWQVGDIDSYVSPYVCGRRLQFSRCCFCGLATRSKPYPLAGTQIDSKDLAVSSFTLTAVEQCQYPAPPRSLTQPPRARSTDSAVRLTALGRPSTPSGKHRNVGDLLHAERGPGGVGGEEHGGAVSRAAWPARA